MNTASSVSAGARLDRLPASRFHWRLLTMIGAGLFLDGFDIYLAGGVLGALVKSGWSTLAYNADFLSATFGGMVVGSWMAGILGDRFGRRFTYQSNLLIFGIASLFGAAAPSMAWLIVARFFMGLGMGAEVVAGYSMLNEFVPRKQRGRWGSSLFTITNSSLFVSSLAGYLIIPNFGWRWMFVIVGVGALFIAYLRKKMPESPRWLESRGRLAEAETVLTGIEEEIALTHALLPVPPSPQAVVRKRSFMSLFQKGLITRTFVGAMVTIVHQTVLYGFISWIPSFLVKHGMSVTTSLGFTVLMTIGGPLGSLLPVFFVDKIGRKRGIIYTSILAMILGSIYPYAQTPGLIALAGFGVVLAVMALSGVTVLYAPELFPTDLRMRGMGFCNTASRLATVVTPFVVVIFYRNYGLTGVVTFMSAQLAILAVTVGLFGIETKVKSLEELEQGLTNGEEAVEAGLKAD